MTLHQKALFCLFTGLVLLLGTVGGIEQCLDLATYDGIYLGTFAVVGTAFMALGTALGVGNGRGHWAWALDLSAGRRHELGHWA